MKKSTKCISRSSNQKKFTEKDLDDICRFINCKNVARPNIVKKNQQEAAKKTSSKKNNSNDVINRIHKVSIRARLKTSLKNKKCRRSKKGIKMMRTKQMHDILFSDEYINYLFNSSEK